MANVRTYALPEELAKQIDDEVARTGTSPQEVIRQRLNSAPRPMRPYAPPLTEHLPGAAPPRTFQDALRDAIEQRTSMAILRSMDEGTGMGGGQQRGLTQQDIAQAVGVAVAQVLDDRLPRRRHRDDDEDEGERGSAATRRLKNLLAEKAELKVLKDMAGDDQPAQAFLQNALAEVNKRIDAANERAAAAERAGFEQRVQAADQRTVALENLLAERTNALETRIEQIQTLRAGGQEPPKSAVAELKEMVSTVDSLRTALGAGGGKPDTWDRVERVIDKGADLLGRGLEGVAAVEAGKRGVPPHATLTQPAAPAYLDAPGGGAQPPQDDILELQDGTKVPVTALPENVPYTITDEKGENHTVSREEFIRAVREDMRSGHKPVIRDTTAPAGSSPAAPATPAAAPGSMPHQHGHAPPPAPAQGPVLNPFTREPLHPNSPRAPPPAVPAPAAPPTVAPPPAAPPAPAPAAPAPTPAPPSEAPPAAEPEPVVDTPPGIPGGAFGLQGDTRIVVDEKGRIISGAPAEDPSRTDDGSR